jgi:hypothetical protein
MSAAARSAAHSWFSHIPHWGGRPDFPPDPATGPRQPACEQEGSR